MRRIRIVAVLALAVFPALAFGQSSSTGNQRVIPTFQVTVTANVRGAAIFVNGERQQQTTPATLNLRRGTYEIRVDSRGYTPWVGTVAVTANTTVRAELLPPYATIVLQIPDEFLNQDVRNPRGMVTLFIDGQLRTEPQIQIRTGMHHVVITSGGLRLESDVYFEAGLSYTLELILQLNLLQKVGAGR